MRAGLRALALALAAAACRPAAAEKPYFGNSSEILARTLRRQLMKDNYDYTSTESEAPGGDGAARGEKERPIDDIFSSKTRFKTKKKHKFKDQSVYAKSVDESLRRGNLYRKLAKRRKKVQRYMNDIDEDMAKRYEARYRFKFADEDGTAADDDIELTTTVKYTVLKVRRLLHTITSERIEQTPHFKASVPQLRSPYRRSGRAAALVQEAGPNGVAIVKLGGGPYPEFRLPRPRRQYMAGRPRAAVGDDEELPPPPADTDRNPRLENKGKTTPVGRVPEAHINDAKSSLRITVTPDEILVL